MRKYSEYSQVRGGQLAINSAAGGYQFYSTSIEETEYGTKIAYLPCSKYNLSQMKRGDKDARDRCCVLHLKGNRKGWIKNLNKSLKFVGFH